jgi:hypothetical protein
VATRSESGTPVFAAASANADLNGAGTGQAGAIVGTGARPAGGFAFEVSSLVDSATTVRSTSASSPARTLRRATGLRLGGSFRRDWARLRERAKCRSISERLRQEESATERGSYPRQGDPNGSALAARPRKRRQLAPLAELAFGSTRLCPVPHPEANGNQEDQEEDPEGHE